MNITKEKWIGKRNFNKRGLIMFIKVKVQVQVCKCACARGDGMISWLGTQKDFRYYSLTVYFSSEQL